MLARASLVAAILLAARAVAAAAPLATLAADVDGDGAPETLALGTDGVLHVGAAAVPLGVTPTKATLGVGPARAKAAIVVRVTTANGDEAIVLTRAAAAWRVAWRGAVGGVGLDAEYQVEVAALPAGIVRYQTRFDVRRCDGKPARLFAEDFDGSRFVRAASVPVELATGAGALPAKLDSATPVAKPQLYQARAASTHAGATDAGALAIPRELDDGEAQTAWRGDGTAVGQFFTFKPRGDAKARQLRVVAGDHGSKAKLAAANRPRELAIVSEQGAWRVELPDAARGALGAAYVVDLPEPISGCVSVVIASVYGSGSTTALAELEVYADGERAGGGFPDLAHGVAIDGPGARSSGQQLARGGAAAVAAVEAELAKTQDPGARRRLVGVLVTVRDPAAAPVLARAATSGWVEGAELVAVAEALGALHQVRELRELAGKQEMALDVRVAAAAALDPGAPDELAALIELAGVGPRELRRAVIERLQAAPVAGLVAAAGAATVPAAAGDLWRAATRAARAHAETRPETLAAMLGALRGAPDYERRYRLVDGVAALGDAPALAELMVWLGALHPGAETAALRQVAARALAKAPRPDALDLVLALARDQDAGVRLAAFGALMQPSDDATAAAPRVPEVDRALGGALGRDHWEDVRVRAAQALGGRCRRPGPAALLTTAVGADPAVGVRAEALVALVQCRAAGVAALLAHTWDDAKAPLVLRSRAIGLAIVLGDAALGARLVGELATWRAAAIESAPALALAVQAANAIGRLGPPGADAALMDALDDAAFPEIVGAAATGLGSLGPTCSPAAKTKLGLLARSDDLQVATPARGAERVCGAPKKK